MQPQGSEVRQFQEQGMQQLTQLMVCHAVVHFKVPAHAHTNKQELQQFTQRMVCHAVVHFKVPAHARRRGWRVKRHSGT